MKHLLFSWIVLCFAGNGFNQSIIDIEKRANQALEKGQYSTAKPDFQTLFSRDPKSPTYNYNYGLCLYYTNEKDAALKHFELASTLGIGICEAHFYLGRLHHLKYDFNRAISAYNTYKKCHSSDALDAARQLNYCENGLVLFKNPSALEVQSQVILPLNGFLSRIEFDELGLGGGYYTDISLQSKMDKKKEFLPHTYVKAGNPYKIFASYGDSPQQISIYIKKKAGENWGTAVKIPLDIAPNRNILYPFFDATNGWLYFSSDGFNSMGGFDFFKVSFNPKTFELGQVVNVGFPFSSTDDDFLFIPLDAEGRNAAFATVRSCEQGKIEFVQAKLPGSNSGIVVVQGNFRDQVNPKNTNIQIKVKDLQRGVEYGPFVSDTSGNYVITLPGSGEYEFKAAISGTQQTFTNQQQLPDQSSEVVFRQEIAYGVKDAKESASFSYQLNQKASEEISILKSMKIAALDKQLNPVPSATIVKGVEQSETSDIDEVLNDLGFKEESTNGKAEALSDKLIGISNLGEDYNDKLLYIERERVQTNTKKRRFETELQSLQRKMETDTNTAASMVYKKYMLQIFDSLILVENEIKTLQNQYVQTENDKSQWDKQGLEQKAMALSDGIRMNTLTNNNDSLSTFILKNKDQIKSMLSLASVASKDSTIREQIKGEISQTNLEIKSFEDQYDQIKTKRKELEVRMSNAKNKREMAEVQVEVDEIIKSDKRISQLLSIKQDEASSLAMDLHAVESRLRIQELTGDLPALGERVVEDKGSVNPYLTPRNKVEKELSSQPNEENISLPNQIAATNATLELLKLRMQEANPEDMEKLAEEFQSVEAKIERQKSELTKLQQDSTSKVGNTIIASNSGNVQENNTAAENKPKGNDATTPSLGNNTTNQATNGNTERNLAVGVEDNKAKDSTTVATNGNTERNPEVGVEGNKAKDSTTVANNRNTERNPEVGVEGNKAKDSTTMATNGNTERNPEVGVEGNKAKDSTTVANNRNTERNPEVGVEGNKAKDSTTMATNGNTERNPEVGVEGNKAKDSTTVANNKNTERNPEVGVEGNKAKDGTTAANNGNTERNPEVGVEGNKAKDSTTMAINGNTERNPEVGVEGNKAKDSTTVATNGNSERNPEVGVEGNKAKDSTTMATNGNSESKLGSNDSGKEIENEKKSPKGNLPSKQSEKSKEELTYIQSLAQTDTEGKKNESLQSLSKQIQVSEQIFRMKESANEEVFNVIFSTNDINSLANGIKQQQTELKKQGSIAEIPLETPSLLLSLSNEVKRSNAAAPEFKEEFVNDEQSAQLAKEHSYDQYVTLRKSLSPLVSQKSKLKDEIAMAKIRYFQAATDEEKAPLQARLISLANQFLVLENEENRIISQLDLIPNKVQYASMVASGILPQNTNDSTPKNRIASVEDVAFRVDSTAKNQNNQWVVNAAMPSGLVYRVQVGAFKNTVPDYFFREFSPVSGETLKNGLTAYMAGFFERGALALNARQEIRNLGYKDAFIVGYCDGERITFAKAMEYEKGGGCTLRNNGELLTEAFNILKSNNLDSSNTAKPKEVFYTVQVASLAKEDNGKLKDVPDLFFLRSNAGKYKYSSGKFAQLEEAQQRKNNLRGQGFADAYVVAYRDGIPVTFKEAEIALNYLQEENSTTKPPENQNLTGVEIVKMPPTYIQLTKKEQDITMSSVGSYNVTRFFVAKDKDSVAAAPILLQQFTPLESILYADFEPVVATLNNEPLIISGEVGKASLSILHDFALKNKIPFHVISQEDLRIAFSFFESNEEEKNRISQLAEVLNLTKESK